jgi:hypothetical protein
VTGLTQHDLDAVSRENGVYLLVLGQATMRFEIDTEWITTETLNSSRSGANRGLPSFLPSTSLFAMIFLTLIFLADISTQIGS